MKTRQASSGVPVIGVTLAYVGLLYAAWTGAWLLFLRLSEQGVLPETPLAKFIYWTAMRVLLWVIPSIALMRRSGKSLREALSPGRIKAIALWGGGMGVLLGIITLVTRAVQGQPLFSVDWGWPLLTAAVIAPIVEEITFRGAVLGALETRFPFAVSNLISGVLFLLVHFPGWYFQGVLAQNLASPVGGALSLLALGWVFGFVFHKSKSLAAGILTHVLNNFFNA